jgi:AmmeMemoRadiSam system protein B
MSSANSSGSSAGIRRPVVAGQFYTGDPRALAAEVDGYFSEVDREDLPGDVVALIAPHAGYMYSGQVAAYAYKQVQGSLFETVIVVAPSHQVAFKGASVYQGGGYETPLGLIPVKTDLAKAIMEQSDSLGFNPRAHSAEHSLEVQLPFLQRALEDFHLVAIVMGDQDLATCQILAEAIVASRGAEKTLIVASSDLSHYHSYDQAVERDGVILKAVNAFDPLALHEALQSRRGEACGGGPMVVAMLAAKRLGASGAKVLKYANSGDVTGDRSHVVGYMAAAIFGQGDSLAQR